MEKGEGKGEGRGGCGFLEDVGECVQCIASTICLLLILGPLLIILGVLFISSAFTNDRQQKIDEFNVSVDKWTADYLPEWQGAGANDWQYNVTNSCGTNTPLTVLSPFDDPEDLGSEDEEMETFASYTRLTYMHDAPPSAGALDKNCTLNFNLFYNKALVGEHKEKAVTDKQLSFSEIRCGRTSTQQRRNGETVTVYNEDSDVRRCRTTCTDRGGTPGGGQSYGSFTCALPVKPKMVCLHVAPSGKSYKIATGTLPDSPEGASGIGCSLAFNLFASSGQIGSGWETTETEFVQAGETDLEVDMQIRHERDPYLSFLDISNGTKNFGLTTGEKLQIGFTLLAIGILIQALVCLCCCCIIKFARDFASGSGGNRPENPVGGAMYDVAGKYGNYIPGGAALGQPVTGQNMQGVPTAGVNQPPPQGYPNSGSPNGYGQKYDGSSSCDSSGH